MMILNPGTEDLDGDIANAAAALDLLTEDLRRTGCTAAWRWHPDGLEHGGRWEAIVTVDGRDHTVSMPGCDPGRTYAGEPWVSPRLYVGGSSWLWPYALSMLTSTDES